MYIADLKTVSTATAMIYTFSIVVSEEHVLHRGASIKNVMILTVVAIALSFGIFPLIY